MPVVSFAEEFTMAEIRKLDVGKVLDKLRSNDAKNSSKMEQVEEKIRTLDEETQRLRAQRNRLKRGPRPGTTNPD
jgi:chromosome segregation ATPase